MIADYLAQVLTSSADRSSGKDNNVSFCKHLLLGVMAVAGLWICYELTPAQNLALLERNTHAQTRLK